MTFFYIFLFIFAPINNVGGNLSKKIKITNYYWFIWVFDLQSTIFTENRHIKVLRKWDKYQ
jgi:hypothetical protein